MKILVTGGAGYIGSFMATYLLEKGYEVLVVDSLERGHKENIPTRAQFLQGNLLDKSFVTQVFAQNKIDAVIHFAAYLAVGESMKAPALYFENNIQPVVNLLKNMVDTNTNNFIFSSTAAVYGTPRQVPIPEDHLKAPESVYGETKLMVEKILEWFGKIHAINYAALRYFNAAGASLDGRIGEHHPEETHIIPNAMRAILGEKEFQLYGTDYDTPDKTAVRDYIHVLDLAEAHHLVLNKIMNEKINVTYNVGTGKGYSNQEVLEMIKKIAGKDIKVTHNARRPGDPPVLVSDPHKIQKELNFSPRYSDLHTIIETAWKWHSTHLSL